MRKVWARMRKRFAEKTGEFGTFDPDNYVLSNPEVMAGLTGFGTKQDVPARITGRENRQQILRDAVRRSNEVIIFYQGLKDFCPRRRHRGHHRQGHPRRGPSRSACSYEEMKKD